MNSTNTILFLDGSCGISGDMTAAALLDLGGDPQKLAEALASLRLDGYNYTVARRKSRGIEGCDFQVNLHHHEHEHHHLDESGEPEHHHTHEHRNLADVYAVIERGELTPRARELAKKIFLIVAESEAEAHACPLDQVHFHEVGAVDSIVDIVSAAVLIDDLDIRECVVTGFSEGSGFVHCQHGDLPVPVPAVLNIARRFGIPLRPTEVQGEMVTPTGIAIAAALRTRNTLPGACTIQKVGLGLGKRDFGRANYLRAMLLKSVDGPDRIQVLEANIDDSTGEELAFAMDALFQAGARDVNFSPCFMKKNRPAVLLRVIADEPLIPVLEKLIFRNTSTIGIRKYPVERTCMDRRTINVNLPGGTVQVKQCTFQDIVRNYPEYDSVKACATASGEDFRTVYEAARQAAGQHHE